MLYYIFLFKLGLNIYFKCKWGKDNIFESSGYRGCARRGLQGKTYLKLNKIQCEFEDVS